jgi:hypothetical protein
MAVWYALMHFLLFLAPQVQKPPEPNEATAESPYVERSQRQFNFYPGGKIEIAGGAPGSFKIIGWQRSTVLVEFEKIIYHLEPQQAKVLSDQFPIQVRYGQTSATIRTLAPPKALASMEVNGTLYVPKDKTDFVIRLISGDLTIGALNGWMEVNLTEGSLEAKSISGYLSSVAVKGDIKVELSGRRWLGQGFTAATRNGTVDLRLPADFSAALQLETRDGNISISFPEQLVDGESVPLRAVANKNARTLKATVGDGGASIRLFTNRGDIRLSAIESP